MISLPLNVFYGAGVPACLLILRKERPAARRDKVLLVYAARHYRELSAQNELRPQDVMRILVHYQAYGDAAKVPSLVARAQQVVSASRSTRARKRRVGRLEAEYQPQPTSWRRLTRSSPRRFKRKVAARTKQGEGRRSTRTIAKIEKQRRSSAAKIRRTR